MKLDIPQTMQERVDKAQSYGKKYIKDTTMKCPKCHSTQIVMIGQQRKGFSIGKAIGGAILAPGVGALAGFIGKNGKYECFCQQCGERFKVK